MSHASPQPTSALTAFMRYVNTRYPLPLHVFYSIAWTMALFGVFGETQGARGSFALGWADVAVIGSVVLLFFFMRTVDEIKDLEYDRIYKPDRALVQGLLSERQMGGYLLICAGVLAGLNVALSPWLVASAGAVMAYSLFLLWFERKVPRFERLLYLNTATSVQLKTLTVGYVYLAYATLHEGRLSLSDAPLMFAFVFAYLHWEVARKIQWPCLAEPGELLYSATPGVKLSLGVPVLLLGASQALILVAIQPWQLSKSAALLPALSLIVLALGSIGLLRQRQKRFALGAFAQVGYVFWLVYLVAFCHGAGSGSWLTLGASPLLLLQLRQVQQSLVAALHSIELRIFRGGVYATAWLVQSPLHTLSRRLMGKLGAATALQRGAVLQPSAQALGPAWQSMFPVDKKKLPIVRVQGDTVYAEIHEYCPLQGTGDLGACDRLMEFDRALLAKLGARLEVLRSQAEPGVTICQVAFHMLEAERPSADAVPALGAPI